MYRFFLMDLLLIVMYMMVSCSSEDTIQGNVAGQSCRDSIAYDDFVYIDKTGKFCEIKSLKRSANSNMDAFSSSNNGLRS